MIKIIEWPNLIKIPIAEKLEIHLDYTKNENEREIKLKEQVNGKILKMNFRLKKISGDASFREFYRLRKGNKTSIIVQASKEKFKNLIVYAVINNILQKNKINAPKL